ncbi:tautomerase family protein [Microbacterium kunmingense]|uniref:tautomerase family protein n=1 Tax=Microbacterium kunmingense TaxID=2915939 RepID=UPI003D714FB4
MTEPSRSSRNEETRKRDPDQIRALIGGVTDAVAESLSAPLESIRVIVTEVPLTHWGSGSATLAEKRGAPPPPVTG